jgi:hypothetical protein
MKLSSSKVREAGTSVAAASAPKGRSVAEPPSEPVT